MNTDTENFLVSLLWALPEDHVAHKNGWTIHEFHPEFIAAVERFCSGFREYLNALDEQAEDSDVYADPDAGEQSFGGDVYFSLSGHGCGFWDARDSEWGDAMQAALEAFSGSKYRFEEIDIMKFKGKIHLAYRTAAYRREYLEKMFGNTAAVPA